MENIAFCSLDQALVVAGSSGNAVLRSTKMLRILRLARLFKLVRLFKLGNVSVSVYPACGLLREKSLLSQATIPQRVSKGHTSHTTLSLNRQQSHECNSCTSISIPKSMGRREYYTGKYPRREHATERIMMILDTARTGASLLRFISVFRYDIIVRRFNAHTHVPGTDIKHSSIKVCSAFEDECDPTIYSRTACCPHRHSSNGARRCYHANSASKATRMIHCHAPCVI